MGINIEAFRVIIQEFIDKNEVEKIKYIFQKFINSSIEENLPHSEIVQLYVEYSILMFELSMYDDFILIMDKAISLGCDKNIYLQILEEAFINPNEESLRHNFNNNKKLLEDFSIVKYSNIDYRGLNYIIPNGKNGEYYLIDKTTLRIIKKYVLNQRDISDDLFNTVLVDDNIFSINFESLSRRNLYIIVDDIKNFLSWLKMRELETKELDAIKEIFLNIGDFENYFLGNLDYLPKNFFVNSLKLDENDLKQTLKKIVSLRNGYIERPKPLLTIGIPTYNRGKRALETVQHILSLPLDYEIEIVISNNGTKNHTVPFYNELSIMQDQDARIVYYEFEENKGLSLNVCEVAELASGDFILYLSDEDKINETALYKVLRDLLDRGQNLSVYRASTLRQPKLKNVHLVNTSDILINFGLTSNYISGNIFNVNYLKEKKIIEYVKENQEQEINFLYPHMTFELFLYEYGELISTDEILIIEGLAEDNDIVPADIKHLDEKSTIPYYVFFESRLKQHTSFVEIFKMLTICKRDKVTYRNLYIKLVNKTFHLVRIAINIYYKEQGYDINELLTECYRHCSNQKFLIGSKSEKRDDIKKIEGIYKYYLTELS